jgi:hypothetical protein
MALPGEFLTAGCPKFPVDYIVENIKQMRKILLPLIALLAIVLAACGEMTPPGGDSGKSPTSPASSAQPACRVDAPAKADATQAALFPSVGNQEWAMGDPDADVTFAEYGDFQ